MTRSEQKEFVKNLTEQIAVDIQRKIDSGEIPSYWDGIEFRLLLADKFQGQIFDDTKSRLKDYRNVIATTNI